MGNELVHLNQYELIKKNL